jgi:hypothetical protein
LTVGFTQYHNAKLLGDIANAGSDVGNFIYINTAEAGYDEKISQSLRASLDMAVSVDGLPI